MAGASHATVAPVRTIEVELRPRSPFDLARSARLQSCGTRRWADGALRLAFRAAGSPARALVRQRSDGTLVATVAAGDDAAAVDHLRFALGTDDDLAPFLRRAERDPLLSRVARSARGLRVVRTSTVAHAALRGVAGQLIAAQEARRIERAVIATVADREVELRLPPTTAELAQLAPARIEALGLAGRRAAALVRLCRSIELERLRDHPTDAVVRRICREPNLGPWTAGVICLQGLGRHEHGLVGDLGLIRLCGHLLGRPATTEDTAALLAPWDEWAGLASSWYLHHPLARQRGRLPGRVLAGLA
jgi:3-methyladenine DNA glycosylase/8-oxoguanine DNA glycosylase